MPDRCQITFAPVDVLDQSGMKGVHDQVDHHYLHTFLTAVVLAGIGAGAQFGGGNSGGYGFSPVDSLRIGIGAGFSQVAQQSLAANRRHPTITIGPVTKSPFLCRSIPRSVLGMTIQFVVPVKRPRLRSG
jgi:type IV secretory pathway VirB10-like protein